MILFLINYNKNKAKKINKKEIKMVRDETNRKKIFINEIPLSLIKK